MSNSAAQEAFDRIKRESIIPESKKVAMFRKSIFWILPIISVLAGSFAAAAIIFIFRNSDFDLTRRYGGGFLLRSMPYVWILLLALFVWLGDAAYAKTTFGHRQSIIKTSAVYIASTVLLGIILTSVGIGVIFERSLAGRGLLHGLLFNQTEVWSHPEQGLLSGTIDSFATSSLVLIDFSGKRWNIDMSGAVVRGRVNVSKGAIIKVLGRIEGAYFVADELRPWVGTGAMSGYNQQYNKALKSSAFGSRLGNMR